MPKDIPEIETDRGKLQQVLLNLVNNAFQAVDNGCNLAINAAPEGRDKVSITISDNGCGMPEENLTENIRTLFYYQRKGAGDRAGTYHHLRSGQKASWKHIGRKQGK